jgi:hypothetical protein
MTTAMILVINNFSITQIKLHPYVNTFAYKKFDNVIHFSYF